MTPERSRPSRQLTLTAADPAWHGRFFAFVDRIFGGLDFVTWARLGGWRADYEVFVLAEGEEIVASVARTRMKLRIGGVETEGFQLGAVATEPERRGRGLSRRLLERALEPAEVGERPVFLFSNETAAGFYPRFGFRRLPQQRFEAAAPLRPAAARLRPFRLEDPAERARLAGLCARAPAAGGFAARDYYPVLLWHLVNTPLRAFWIEVPEAFLILGEEAGIPKVLACLAERPFPLPAVLPGATAAPVEKVAFGFDPGGWWPADAVKADDDPETRLFVRSFPSLPPTPFRFPDLAQT